ncbi:BrnA antitoxin family protein [Sphingomonas sp.]|uniref:BrnA antitoxin family protein n=1 Tax=Sphingomonas sp. TaxID=28214 RepID=UPI0025DC3EE1|nr:BrnA antitoxin family protein [Sphingomonas sp.]MBV9528287.1 BrnA antitoxin family protein [Sphingomonas sp.]
MERDDAPRITADWAASAELRDGDRIIREASPPVRIGRPPKAASERKQQVTMRLAPDLLAAMRASGAGWQTRAEEVLRREFLHQGSIGMDVAVFDSGLLTTNLTGGVLMTPHRGAAVVTEGHLVTTQDVGITAKQSIWRDTHTGALVAGAEIAVASLSRKPAKQKPGQKRA